MHIASVCLTSFLFLSQATKQIEPGQVIMVEQPFAAVLNQEILYTHCSHCFSETAALVPYVISASASFSVVLVWLHIN